MRNYLTFLMLAVLLTGRAGVASIFDQIRQRTNQAVEKAVDEAIDSVGKQSEPDDPSIGSTPQTETQNQTATNTTNAPIQSEDDLYGYWEGLVRPTTGGGIMSGMTVYVTIAPDFEGMRVSGAGAMCLAELEPTDTLGQYQATFIDERQNCGSSATVRFMQDGNVTIRWDDMPNASDTTYTGQLIKKTPPVEKHWSTGADARGNLDIVGLQLGMTYEDALAYLDEHHPDLKRELNFVKDAGTSSILLKLTQSDARKAGPVVYGEQITLVFESQTPDEMEVEQDPEVLAAIAERNKIIEERDAMLQEQRESSRRIRRRTTEPSVATDQPALPEIPDMPKLRPPGAEAELVVVTRQIQYPSRKGPHPDNIISAMSDKYGTPSINLDKQASGRGEIRLGWVYDQAGNFVPDAEGGPCDLLSVTGYDLKEIAHHYETLNNVTDIFYPVMLSDHCGLVMITQIKTETDGSVWRIASTAYDQQRLLADEWHRKYKLNQALVAQQKAKSGAIKQRDIPDF